MQTRPWRQVQCNGHGSLHGVPFLQLYANYLSNNSFIHVEMIELLLSRFYAYYYALNFKSIVYLCCLEIYLFRCNKYILIVSSHTHIYAYIHIHTHICIYVYIYIYIYIYADGFLSAPRISPVLGRTVSGSTFRWHLSHLFLDIYI